MNKIEEIKELPTGKTIISKFDNNNIIEEAHVYGYGFEPTLRITRMYDNGKIAIEIYISNGKSLSKKKYEEIRKIYPDMPPASDVKSLDAQLREDLREMHKAWLKKFDSHAPSEEEAKKDDERNQRIIDEEDSKELGLPALSESEITAICASRSAAAFMKKIKKLGVEKIWLTDVDEDFIKADGKKLEFNGIVVAIPSDHKVRRKLFIESDKRAGKNGFSGPMDEGQKYLYFGF